MCAATTAGAACTFTARAAVESAAVEDAGGAKACDSPGIPPPRLRPRTAVGSGGGGSAEDDTALLPVVGVCVHGGLRQDDDGGDALDHIAEQQ